MEDEKRRRSLSMMQNKRIDGDRQCACAEMREGREEKRGIENV
jgi:hypothetical protein